MGEVMDLNEYGLIILAGIIVLFLVVYFDDNGDGHA